MIIKVRYEKLGGHYHCAVFSTKAEWRTFEKCGDLVFRDHEWDEVRQTLFQHDIVEERYCEINTPKR